MAAHDTHQAADMPASVSSDHNNISQVPTLVALLSSQPRARSPAKPRERPRYLPSRTSSHAPLAFDGNDVGSDALTSRTGPRMAGTGFSATACNSTRKDRHNTAYWRSVGMFVEDSEEDRVAALLAESSTGEDTCDESMHPPRSRDVNGLTRFRPSKESKAPIIFDVNEEGSDDSLPSVEELVKRPWSTPTPKRNAVKASNETANRSLPSKVVEVIELLSSDEESPICRPTLNPIRCPSPPPERETDTEPLDNNAGMLFFEPSRRPRKMSPLLPPEETPRRQPRKLRTPKTRPGDTRNLLELLDDDSVCLISSSEDEQPASPRKPSATPNTGRRPASSTTATPVKTPGRGKKGLQAQLEKLAEETVADLNTRVFGGRIPEDMQLVWSKRLNTTAGRANWKRIRKENGDDIHQCSIELSTKVLDNEDRVLNTVAHELCHLACWVIDGEIQPAHGRAFKGWGRKVMKCRPEITVTTKHDYEIAYKYEWRCTNTFCGRTYGRHSKSINPDQHVCGGCKGRLEPMFQTYSPSKRTAFQDYLKANMKDLKATQPALSHRELMQELSRRFKENKEKASAGVDDLIEKLTAIEISSPVESPAKMPGAY